MPARQSGITGVAGIWAAGAGEYIARLASAGRSMIDIIGFLRERFPDASNLSIYATLNRYRQGAEYAANLYSRGGPSIPGCRPPVPNPALAARYSYLVQLRWDDPRGGPSEYRTTTLVSNTQLSQADFDRQVSLLQFALESPAMTYERRIGGRTQTVNLRRLNFRRV